MSASNLDSGSPTAISTPTNFSTSSLVYASTGDLLTGGEDGVIRRWSPPLQEIDAVAPSVHGTTMDVSPDGRLLAAAMAGPLFQSVGVGVWDVSTPAGPVLDGTIPVAAQTVSFLNPRVLLTGTGTGQIQLWDLSDPRSPQPGAALGTAVIPHSDGWSFGGEVTG